MLQTDIQINPADSMELYDWIFHLSDGDPSPEVQLQARHLLVFEAGVPGSDLIHRSGRHYTLSQHLNPDNFTELPSELLSLLFEPEVTKLNFPDNRAIALQQRNGTSKSAGVKNKTATATSRPLHFWIWTVLLLLFLTERMLSPKHE